jgi:FkbM family methyltransferase
METPISPPDITAYIGSMTEVESELLKIFRPDEMLIILDVGACEGEDSIRYAKRFPNAQIYSFEPLPSNQALVLANFLRYGISNAELIPVALSDQAGEAEFHVSSGRPPDEFAGKNWNYGNKSNSLLAPAGNEPMYGWIEFKESIKVATLTLDEFCRRRGIDRIDFIHMDVQGAEHLVLAGASASLRKTSTVWLEVSDTPLYTGQKLRGEMQSLLGEKGFLLGFEVRRQLEGDQFYINRRTARCWTYLARHRIHAAILGLRHLCGHIVKLLRAP